MAQNDNLIVNFLDVGHGDSILVQIHDKNMLIDTGDQEHGAAVVSFLKSNNVSQIDVLVASNPCSDHIGGMKAVLENFTVKQVWDTGLLYDDQAYKDFRTIVSRKDIPYRVAESGQSIDMDPSLSIDVLSPPKQRFGYYDTKNNSIVLKLTYRNVSFLFMSDAGFDAENSLLAQSQYPLNSDVLKVADHGSLNSSSRPFITIVSPNISVIGAGVKNTRDEPASTILNRLSVLSNNIYVTGYVGIVTMVTDGNKLNVNTEKSVSNMNPLWPVPCPPIPTPYIVSSTPKPTPTIPILIVILIFGLMMYYIINKSK